MKTSQMWKLSVNDDVDYQLSPQDQSSGVLIPQPLNTAGDPNVSIVDMMVTQCSGSHGAYSAYCDVVILITNHEDALVHSPEVTGITDSTENSCFHCRKKP